MNDVSNCYAMESMCRERAETDPKNATKWLGQAERWSELAKDENAWRLQKRSAPQQQAHAGQMATQPRPVDGGSARKQMG